MSKAVRNLVMLTFLSRINKRAAVDFNPVLASIMQVFSCEILLALQPLILKQTSMYLMNWIINYNSHFKALFSCSLLLHFHVWSDKSGAVRNPNSSSDVNINNTFPLQCKNSEHLVFHILAKHVHHVHVLIYFHFVIRHLIEAVNL